MNLYRNRPVTVEARRWEGEVAQASEIIQWVHSHGGRASHHWDASTGKGGIIVTGVFGPEHANPGDYIIRMASGEWRVMEGDVFPTVFESVLPQ